MSTKDTTQWVFAQLQPRWPSPSWRYNDFQAPEGSSSGFPDHTPSLKGYSDFITMRGFTCLELHKNGNYACIPFFLKICFFDPCSSLHVIHIDVFGPSLISLLPRRIPPEGCAQGSVPILSLAGLWVAGSSGCCDKDITDKSSGAYYSCHTRGVESERVFSILKMFLDKTCWF